MECIRDFLQDNYQSKLRIFAQGKSERYEETLTGYSKIFIAHLNLVRKEARQCKKCKDRKQCLKIRRIINQIKEEEIQRFFDQIRQVYLDWIKSEPSKSLKDFESLLKRKKLFQFERTIRTYDVFFKARTSKEVLTQWDMFHIPFNKRYLIENQRYSITGQPMLYVGASVIDVAEEIESSDTKDFKISIVQLPEKDFKIYNLKNSITDIFNELTTGDLIESEAKTYTKADFFKLILSSICSFRKRQELKGYSFCEEYVIPQILALILRRNNFDGISYFSTKRFEGIKIISKKNSIKEDNTKELSKEENDTKENNSEESYTEKTDIEKDNSYKENIAIFTNLTLEHVYDHDLYEKISMSVPIDISKIEDITIDDLKEITEEIELSKNQEKISKSGIIFSSFQRVYSDMMINENAYFDTEFGKLHLYELYSVLNEILVA